MQRRSVLLSGTALAFAPALRSQQRLPVVGFLNAASPREYGKPVRAFLRSLEDAGFMEGQSVGVEYRWGDGHYERLDDLAADLVARQVSVIAATSTPANLIAKRHTNTIPIVFTTSSDPLQLGLVQSISRPEANVTGITTLNVELGPKRLDIVEQFLPGVRVIAHLINPSNPNI